jgi:triosephosphate isomerase
MKLPIILVNFKCCEEATGERAFKLAKVCEFVSFEYGLNISVAPQFVDIKTIAEEVEIPVFSQHIDPIDVGAFTGHVTALSVKEVGATGVLINHSERKLDLEKIKECIELAKKYGLISVCCSASIDESKEIAKFNPDFIAYEPPELIGTGISVSQTKPEVITETVNEVKRLVPNIKVLCGAGIKNGEDAKKALELGTVGVLLSSGVVKADSPEDVLVDIAEAIKQY